MYLLDLSSDNAKYIHSYLQTVIIVFSHLLHGHLPFLHLWVPFSTFLHILSQLLPTRLLFCIQDILNSSDRFLEASVEVIGDFRFCSIKEAQIVTFKFTGIFSPWNKTFQLESWKPVVFHFSIKWSIASWNCSVTLDGRKYNRHYSDCD